MRFVRTRTRVYPSDDHKRRRCSPQSHSEYAIVNGDGVVARIVFNGGKWIALQVSQDNQFGRPVSPMNYVLLRDVKEWALERFSRG